MKETIVKCDCDYCKKEMSEWEYETAIKLTLVIDLENIRGGCGNSSHVKMNICDECGANLGIINDGYYHKTIYSKNRIYALLDKIKINLVNFMLKKKV